MNEGFRTKEEPSKPTQRAVGGPPPHYDRGYVYRYDTSQSDGMTTLVIARYVPEDEGSGKE